MSDALSPIVARIRKASREVVRELGFMNRTLAGTTLSASAVHAIIETGRAGRLAARDLAAILRLEKSTVSRLVGALIDRGEIQEVPSSEDGRRKDLLLTDRGEATLKTIDRYAERKVAAALLPLNAPSRRAVLAGLETYAAALGADRTTRATAEVVVREGYAPGVVGSIVAMHAAYYQAWCGFGAVFETKVAAGLAEFVPRLETPGNALWRIEQGGAIVGSIAIDGETMGEDRAQLRWFIIDDGARGSGLGRVLMAKAVRFCDDCGFRQTRLWTLKGLDAARHLYESHGFALAEEYVGSQWGKEIVEQQFIRPGPG